jgi:hypothetical protein
MAFNLGDKKLKIEIDATELTPKQIRSVKSVMSMMEHVLTTDDESEFFEGSAELMRMIATLIKQSSFSEEYSKNKSISYSDQALEYSVDMLQDFISDKKVIRYDN